MNDPRVDRLAKIVTEYSCKVKRGDVVQIDFHGAAPLALVEALQTRCLKRGAAQVETRCHFPELQRAFFDHASKKQLALFPQHEMDFMKQVDVYIAIRGWENSKIFSSVAPKKMSERRKLLWPITEYRVKHTRWCVLIYPTEGIAQDAGMSLAEFEDFYFDACLRDWDKMAKNMTQLQRLLTRTKEIRVVASDTDLTFTKEGIDAVKCEGLRNMPDGEVFTAPKRDSVNGHIRYNTPSQYQGREYSGVRLDFEKGRIVKADCETGDPKALKAIFDTDEGARHIGEFAIGINHGIRKPIKEILFDEKIGGSIHLTPGACYEECDNGNQSAVHWDLVKILKGDGELWFDGRLIQKNGRFTLDYLKPLNS